MAMPILKKPSPPMHWAGQKISRRKSKLSMRGSRTAMSCSTSLPPGKSPCASPTMTPRSTLSDTSDELRLSNERLRAILQGLDEGVVSIENNQLILLTSREMCIRDRSMIILHTVRACTASKKSTSSTRLWSAPCGRLHSGTR